VLIYKILLPAEWAAFEAAGTFDGSPLDRESGYVHCSDRRQVGVVAGRVFGAEPELVVVALDADRLDQWLRWEDVPGDGVFPHVYAPLPRTAVVAVYRIAGAERVDDTLPAE
jgi:uncharacterized protein (DUF952 family)